MGSPADRQPDASTTHPVGRGEGSRPVRCASGRRRSTTYLVRGQLGQAHRAAGVQLLGGDADLGAEAELAAVGEPGRGVDHHRRRVDPGDEPAGGGCDVGDDRLGVPGAAPRGCARSPRRAESTTPAAMSSERYSVAQSSSVAGDGTPAAARRRDAPASPCTVTPASRSAASAGGRNASATSRCTSSVSAALQTLGRWVLELSSDRARAIVEVGGRRRRRRGSCRRRSRSPAPSTPRRPCGSGRRRRAGSARRPGRGRASARSTESRPAPGDAAATASAGSPAPASASRSTVDQRGVRAVRRRRAAQQHRVAALEAEPGGVDGDVGPGLVDDADDAERHPHLAQLAARWAACEPRTTSPTGSGRAATCAHRGGDGGDPVGRRGAAGRRRPRRCRRPRPASRPRRWRPARHPAWRLQRVGDRPRSARVLGRRGRAAQRRSRPSAPARRRPSRTASARTSAGVGQAASRHGGRRRLTPRIRRRRVTAGRATRQYAGRPRRRRPGHAQGAAARSTTRRWNGLAVDDLEADDAARRGSAALSWCSPHSRSGEADRSMRRPAPPPSTGSRRGPGRTGRRAGTGARARAAPAPDRISATARGARRRSAVTCHIGATPRRGDRRGRLLDRRSVTAPLLRTRGEGSPGRRGGRPRARTRARARGPARGSSGRAARAARPRRS